jgi:hypothetical protein
MATVVLNPILERVRGKVGEVVFRRRLGKLEVYPRPVFRERVWTEAQRRQQERFRLAMAYVQRVRADPQALATYQTRAQQEGMTAFRLMMRDYFSAETSEVQMDFGSRIESGSSGD